MADWDMKPIANPTHFQRSDPKPIEIVGAGPLLSTVWKLGNEHSSRRYRFNVVRQTSDRGIVSDLFQPTDLIHFVKLIQVLAAVIANDGCLTHDKHLMLRTLSQRLDEFLGGAADESKGETIPNTRSNSQNDHSKGTQHGQATHT